MVPIYYNIVMLVIQCSNIFFTIPNCHSYVGTRYSFSPRSNQNRFIIKGNDLLLLLNSYIHAVK